MPAGEGERTRLNSGEKEVLVLVEKVVVVEAKGIVDEK